VKHRRAPLGAEGPSTPCPVILQDVPKGTRQTPESG